MGWNPSNVLLKSNRWTWLETQTSYSSKGGWVAGINETYEVDPRQLSTPVSVNGSTVIFECTLNKCIHVQRSVQTMTIVNNVPDETTSSTEQRASNLWHFSSEDETKREANAMNVALTHYGARARVF